MFGPLCFHCSSVPREHCSYFKIDVFKKKIMIRVMIEVINIVFLKKFILLNLKMDFFCLSLIFVFIGSQFVATM